MTLSEYKPLATAGNGSIYNSGFVSTQEAAVAQTNAINATKGGKTKRFHGGAGTVQVQPVHVAYSDGGQTSSLVTDLTRLNNASQTQAALDGQVSKTGGMRTKRTKRTKKTKKTKKTKRSKRSGRTRRNKK